MGAPLSIGTTVIFQKFGVDIYEVDVFDSIKILKKSIDFVGFSQTGEYSSANYSATTYKDMQNDYMFKGKESFEVEFDPSDDVSFL
jgi:hypothetical protein